MINNKARLLCGLLNQHIHTFYTRIRTEQVKIDFFRANPVSCQRVLNTSHTFQINWSSFFSKNEEQHSLVKRHMCPSIALNISNLIR